MLKLVVQRYWIHLLLLSSLSPAMAEDEINIEPITRPAAPAITLKGTIEEENEGGFITDILHLRCSQFHLQAAPPPEGWRFQKNNSVSLSFKPIGHPSIELTYSFYHQKNFIESLEPAYIKAYVEGLKQTYTIPKKSTLTVLNEQDAFAPQKPIVKMQRPDGSFYERKRTLGRYPLGEQYKVVEYEVTTIDHEQKETTIRYMDYILLFESYTFIAQFKAPPTHFGRMRSKVDAFIRTTQANP